MAKRVCRWLGASAKMSSPSRAILKNPKVLANLEERGQRIADAAGGAPDFEVEGEVRSGRAHVSVRTATQEGRRAEAEDRALSRALDAGR